MPYLSFLDTRACDPGEFALLEKFRYQFKLNAVFFEVAVPRRFITDFASVPLLVQALPGFDVNGGSRYPAVVHDYLYCCQGRVEVQILDGFGGTSLRGSVSRFSRAQCDDIFRMAVLDVGGDPYSRQQVLERYSEFEANLFWAGVRAGGWYYWNKRKAGPTPDDFLSAKQIHQLDEMERPV